MLDLVQDCLRFVNGYFDIISASSAHIYHSPSSFLPPNPATPACRRLIGHAFTPDELPSLIEAIFLSKDERDAIYSLPGDDAQTFIDIIDEARSISIHANRN